MRPPRRSARAAVHGAVIGLSLVLVACASGAPDPDPVVEAMPSDHEIVLRVRNNLIPRIGVVVSVMPAGRPERVLGLLAPDETGEWLIDTRQYAGSFYVVARLDGRRALRSRRVQILSFAVVSWDLNLETVRVERVR